MKKLYALLLSLCAAAGVNAQYCTPTCAYPAGGCTYGEVALFALTGATSTLLDTLGCTGSGYENNTTITSMTTTISVGGTYTFTAAATFFDPRFTQVWIDYNNDYTFSSSETIGGHNNWASSSSTMSFSDTFTVPTSAYLGTVRIRFVNLYGSTVYYPSINPCLGSSYMYGDVRDYLITIDTGSTGGSSGCTGTPAGGTATSTSTVTCGSHNIYLSASGATSTSGTTYQWEQSTDGGTTWTAISGAVGLTSGITDPLVNTMYRLAVTCGSSTAYSSTTSIAVNRVNGRIDFGSASLPDTMSLKVWLIDYNASAGTLTAIDSQITCQEDSIHCYYEFNTVPSATYLVKAKSLDATSSMVGSSGFVPTYGASSAHWSGATSITHSGGTNTQNISIVYGTVTSGPGFIGGLITSGAGKNTAADIPAVNMLVFLKNTTTGILTQTYTNATGRYNFAGIPYGSYVIYPEEMGYVTTPSNIITLNASYTGSSTTNFKQYNTSKTIKPITVGIQAIETSQSFNVYPNPSTGNLNVKWDDQLTGAANVVVSDITGREVYTTTLNIAATSGNAALNLPALNNGIYFVKIKAENINFSEKLLIQH